jgi:zona occludens toxin
MIYLFTGIPGSSKTLNVLKFVNEDSAFKGRTIYYHRIKELTLPWVELTADEVMNWDTLPDGSVLIVDEAQYLLPVRDPRKSLPDWVLKMSEHRHKGLDLIFITQSPMLLDAGFRRFVGRHVHIERIFGLESAKWMTWEKCVTEVDDYHKRKEAVTKRVSFDKKYYGTYKSAEVHTHKKRIPLKVILPFLVLIVLIGLVYHFVTNFNKSALTPSAVDSPSITPASVVNSLASQSGLMSINKPREKQHLSLSEYIEVHTPRIPDIPYSAPVYDELTKPKTFPRPQCIKFNGDEFTPSVCKCFTQQATPLSISQDACNRYVKSGWFNPTKAEGNSDSASTAGAHGVAKAQPRPRASGANVLVTR